MSFQTSYTLFERERILFFLIRDESITKIARLRNHSKFTISRKIRRNAASADPSMPSFHSKNKSFMYSAEKPVGRISAWTTHRYSFMSRLVSWSFIGR